jgi:hypothetical protein
MRVLAAAAVVSVLAVGPLAVGPPAAGLSPGGAPAGGLSFTTHRAAPVAQGWTAGPCPGAVGPVRCMFRAGDPAGPVFLDMLPQSQVRLLRGVRTPGDLQQAVRAIARQVFREFRADRAQFCPGYDAERGPVVGRMVAGRQGVRWSETLRAPDGTVDEQLVHYLTLRRGMEYLLWAEAVAGDACYPDELSHWRPDDLRAARHPLDVAVARATLP